jgi:Transglutaminase-like superfamily
MDAVSKPCFLARDVYCCEVNEGVVFLNLHTNRYLGLSRDARRALRYGVTGWPTHNRPDDGEPPLSAHDALEALGPLIAKGLLTTSSEQGRPACSITLRADEALAAAWRRDSKHRVTFQDVLRFVAAVILTGIGLKLYKTRYLINRLQSNRVKQLACADEQQLIRRVSAFWRLRAWTYTARGSCLFDSLVLADFLVRSGIRPTLVMGVQTKPSGAHAWVQCDKWVLNDTVENIQQFGPILTTGADAC